MPKLKDLKAAAVAKLTGVHQDVLTYVSALETKVQSNRLYLYGAGAVIVAIIVWHLFKK